MKLENQSNPSIPKTNICKICFQRIAENTIHASIAREVTICHDCLIKLKPVLETFYLDDVECLHLYFYTHKIQELLYQFKGCSDYELRTVFLEYYISYLNFKFNGYYMIPAPSSKESDEERGFNHVVEIFKCLRLKMLRIIHKTKQIKQADLTTKEREKIGDILVIDDVDLRGRKILLVDDVYTTGSTIKAMIKLVRQQGAKNIKVLLMSKTIDLEKRE
jgi:competence protein ComFC